MTNEYSVNNIVCTFDSDCITKTDTGGMQMRQQYVENIPIPVVSENVKQKIVDIVQLVINNHYVENELQQLTSVIDTEIYSSFGLNSDEIKKIEFEINKRIQKFPK